MLFKTISKNDSEEVFHTPTSLEKFRADIFSNFYLKSIHRKDERLNESAEDRFNPLRSWGDRHCGDESR